MTDNEALHAVEMAVLRKYGFGVGAGSLDDLEAQKREYNFQQSAAGKVVMDRLDCMAEKMRKISGKKTPVNHLYPLVDAKTNTIQRFFVQKGK